MHQKDKNRERRLQEFKPLEATRYDRALDYHNRVQKQWEAQAKYLAKITGRDPSTLSMFSDDDYRRANEERELITRVVHSLANKELGVWKPLARIGDIYAQPDKTTLDPIDIIRNPEEKDGVPGSRPTSFFKSKYYKKRVKQLKQFIDKVRPFEPEYEGLLIVGQPIELGQFKSLPEVKNEEPEIVKQSGISEEDKYESVVKVSMNCKRLFFQSTPGATQAKSIEVTNEGTSAVYYQWSVAPDIELMVGENENRSPIKQQSSETADPFNWRMSDSFIVPKNVQPKVRSEFCFTQLSGSILPGNTTTFSFSFKSDVPGCFLQRWVLHITPAEAPYHSFTVYLRGCCQVEPPDLTAFRQSIDNSLHESERSRCLEEIMTSIFDRVQKIVKLRGQHGEERIDGDVLVDDRAPTFEEANKEWGLVYSPGLFASLQSLAEETWDCLDIQGFDRFWDMRIRSLSDTIMTIPDAEKKRELLVKMNNILTNSQNFSKSSNISTNLTYSLAFVQLSILTDEIPEQLTKCAQENKLELAPFVVPHVPTQSELEEAQESQRKKHRGKRPADKRATSKKAPTKKGAGKGGDDDQSRISSPTEARSEIPPEIKLQLRAKIVETIKSRLKKFEKLSGESAGVAKQLTRVNEMDQLDTNLDVEVDDDLVDL